MINRHYYCTKEDCDCAFQLEQKIMDDLKRVCPKCGEKTLFQDLSGIYGGIVRGKHEVSTVREYAELNTKELGNYEKESKTQQIAEEKETINKSREERLEKAGHKLYKPKESNIDLPKLDPEISKRVKENDEAGIKKYINEGK